MKLDNAILLITGATPCPGLAVGASEALSAEPAVYVQAADRAGEPA